MAGDMGRGKGGRLHCIGLGISSVLFVLFFNTFDFSELFLLCAKTNRPRWIVGLPPGN